MSPVWVSENKTYNFAYTKVQYIGYYIHIIGHSLTGTRYCKTNNRRVKKLFSTVGTARTLSIRKWWRSDSEYHDVITTWRNICYLALFAAMSSASFHLHLSFSPPCLLVLKVLVRDVAWTAPQNYLMRLLTEREVAEVSSFLFFSQSEATTYFFCRLCWYRSSKKHAISVEEQRASADALQILQSLAVRAPQPIFVSNLRLASWILICTPETSLSSMYISRSVFLSSYLIQINLSPAQGPSYKRGPPKGYIHAIELRLRQVESILGTIIGSRDDRSQSLVAALKKDDLAREIISRVDTGPFGPTGRLSYKSGFSQEAFITAVTQPYGRAKSDRAKRDSRVTREIVSSTRGKDLLFLSEATSHFRRWTSKSYSWLARQSNCLTSKHF